MLALRECYTVIKIQRTWLDLICLTEKYCGHEVQWVSIRAEWPAVMTLYLHSHEAKEMTRPAINLNLLSNLLGSLKYSSKRSLMPSQRIIMALKDIVLVFLDILWIMWTFLVTNETVMPQKCHYMRLTGNVSFFFFFFKPGKLDV